MTTCVICVRYRFTVMKVYRHMLITVILSPQPVKDIVCSLTKLEIKVGWVNESRLSLRLSPVEGDRIRKVLCVNPTESVIKT